MDKRFLGLGFIPARGNATPADVAKGKTFQSGKGFGVQVGTLENTPTPNTELQRSSLFFQESITLAPGQHRIQPTADPIKNPQLFINAFSTQEMWSGFHPGENNYIKAGLWFNESDANVTDLNEFKRTGNLLLDRTDVDAQYGNTTFRVNFIWIDFFWNDYDLMFNYDFNSKSIRKTGGINQYKNPNIFWVVECDSSSPGNQSISIAFSLKMRGE